MNKIVGIFIIILLTGCASISPHDNDFPTIPPLYQQELERSITLTKCEYEGLCIPQIRERLQNMYSVVRGDFVGRQRECAKTAFQKSVVEPLRGAPSTDATMYTTISSFYKREPVECKELVTTFDRDIKTLYESLMVKADLLEKSVSEAYEKRQRLQDQANQEGKSPTFWDGLKDFFTFK